MNNLSSISGSVGALLKDRGETLSVAESSAGGLISASLLVVPGASAYFLGGSVIYTRVAQRELLGVPDYIMTGMRASTEEYALLNSRSIRKSLCTTWGLSETGASGPDGNRYGDVAGHACIGVAGPVERTITLATGSADREENMWLFATAAIDLLEQCLGSA